MKYKSKDAEKSAVMNVAELMVAAARTAPKGCGIDNIEALILDGEDKDTVAAEMRKIDEERNGIGPFGRDAGNLDNSEAVVLLGVKNAPINLSNCGLCGFGNCGGAIKAGSNCAFNVTDLGIATGSAAAVAMDHRIDNRIMWTVGKAAVRLQLMPDDVRIAYGIPLSTSGKSIFFDR